MAAGTTGKESTYSYEFFVMRPMKKRRDIRKLVSREGKG
jgi:hypothetical protein